MHRLLPEPQRRAHIFGVDLFPWHSAGWGGMTWTEPVIRWMEGNVIHAVRSIAPGTRLGQLCRANERPPAALAVGASVRDVLRRAGFAVEALPRVDRRPNAAAGKPNGRRFYRCTAKDGSLEVLVTTAPRSNTVPSAAFDDVVRHHLGIDTQK